MKINVVVHPYVYLKKSKKLLLFFSIIVRHNLPIVNQFAIAKWYISISPPQMRREGESLKGFVRQYGIESRGEYLDRIFNANTKA